MPTAEAPLSRHLTRRRDASGRPSFVKAARSAGHREDLLRETAVYGLLIDRCPATAARAPRDVRWNEDADELEMEAIAAPNLAEHVRSHGTLDPVVASTLGRAIGELHREAGEPGPAAPRSDWLRGGLGVVRPTPRRLELLSGGGFELLKLIQRSAELEERISALAPPSQDAIVHGDLRWENVLVGQGDDSQIWLVDWEMGGAGERAWDVGCFAAACVSAWLCSIPSVPGVPPERLADEAEMPMEALVPGLAAFWAAYCDSAPADGAALIERCAEMAAVRLVHSGFECTEFDSGLHPCAVAHVQVAAHLLRDPAGAARDLLCMS